MSEDLRGRVCEKDLLRFTQHEALFSDPDFEVFHRDMDCIPSLDKNLETNRFRGIPWNWNDLSLKDTVTLVRGGVSGGCVSFAGERDGDGKSAGSCTPGAGGNSRIIQDTG